MNKQELQQFIDENPNVKKAIKNLERKHGSFDIITANQLHEEVKNIEQDEESELTIRREIGEYFSLITKNGEVIATVNGISRVHEFARSREMFFLIEKALKLTQDPNPDDNEINLFVAELHLIIDLIKKPKAGI